MSLQMEGEMGLWLVWTFNPYQEAPLPLGAFQGSSGSLKSWHEPRGILWGRLLCYGQEFTARSQESSTAISKGIYLRTSLAKDLPANGETPLCFHLKFFFFRAISGLFSKA